MEFDESCAVADEDAAEEPPVGAIQWRIGDQLDHVFVAVSAASTHVHTGFTV